MFPQNPTGDSVDSKTYPLGEQSEQANARNARALVALSHTPLEQRLYSAMLSAQEKTFRSNIFTARHLMFGKRLNVSKQTVKFHLRHIFVKFGAKRRAELISRLLR
jgi:Bacterial regulatory proteins, luxR family